MGEVYIDPPGSLHSSGAIFRAQDGQVWHERTVVEPLVPHGRFRSGRAALIGAAFISAAAWFGGFVADEMIAHHVLPKSAEAFNRDFADPVRKAETQIARNATQVIKRGLGLGD